MKKGELQKLREKDLKELKDEIHQLREILRGLRFDLVSGKVKNSAAVKETKKKIACILTLIREKEESPSKEDGNEK
jgi:large subunit ribosomal protein L29